MTIQDVIKFIDSNPNNGLQLTKLNGLLRSTWVIYKRDTSYYYFDINEKFLFDEQHRYSYEELIKEFNNCLYQIDDDFL